MKLNRLMVEQNRIYLSTVEWDIQSYVNFMKDFTSVQNIQYTQTSTTASHNGDCPDPSALHILPHWSRILNEKKSQVAREPRFGQTCYKKNPCLSQKIIFVLRFFFIMRCTLSCVWWMWENQIFNYIVLHCSDQVNG